MVDQVRVQFEGDATGVRAGSAQSAEAVRSLAAVVGGLRDAFLVAGGAATGSFREIRTGAIEAAEHVKGVGAAVVEFRELISGIGEALIAAFAVEQLARFAEKMAEVAESTYHTALTFGLTTDQVQRMKAQAAGIGIPFEALSGAMMRLDKAFATAKDGGTRQKQAFDALGISVTENLTQTQLLSRAMEALGRMDSGPAKVALAMQLFGRNIQNIGPMINLTKEQMAELNAKIDESGAVSSEAEAKGLMLAESFNSNKIAMMGLGNVMATALAPAMSAMVDGLSGLVTGFVRSYNAGGTAKTLMDALVFTVRLLADGITFLGALAVFTFETINGIAYVFAGVMTSVGATVVGDIHIMMDAFRSLGTIIEDVFSGHWDRLQADMHDALQRLTNDVTAASVEAGTQMAKGFTEGSNAWLRGDRAMQGYLDFEKKLWGHGQATPALPKAGKGGTGDDPSKETKTKGPSQMQLWEEELKAAEVAASDFFGDQTAKELAFWQEKLQIATTGSKEWVAIQTKIYELSKTQARAARQTALDDAKQTEQERVSHADKELADLKVSLAAQAEAIRAARASGGIGFDEEYAALKSVQARELDAEREHEDAIYQIKLAEHQRELELYATDPVNREKVSKQIEVLAVRHQDALTNIATKGSRDRQKMVDQEAAESQRIWESRIGPIAQSWTSGLRGMLEGTQSWRQALGGVLDSILSQFLGFVEHQVVVWASKEMANTTATVAGATVRTGVEATANTASIAMSATNALIRIGHAAAVAAAGAYSAIAQIPVIGPFLAPAAAAAALLAVIGIGRSIVSARGGMDRVGEDGQMAVLHQDEMVLSAQYANPLRDLLASASFGGTGAGLRSSGATQPGGGGGDTHLHVHATDAQSVERLFENNGDALGRVMKRQLRDLKLSGMQS